jgi:hypothetical protein
MLEPQPELPLHYGSDFTPAHFQSQVSAALETTLRTPPIPFQEFSFCLSHHSSCKQVIEVMT